MTTTREAWLEAAIETFRPRFDEVGLPLPEKIHISVGFGYGAKRESATLLGQCWARSASEDAVNHIFVSPELADTAKVLSTLLHELIHAADDVQSGHRGAFAEAAVRLGLEGPMTGTTPGITLAAELVCISETLGEYPHGALHPRVPAPTTTSVGPDRVLLPGGPPPRIHSGPRTQGTRMRKVVCPCCGYTVRTTAKWLAVGTPLCPLGTQMEEV